MNLGFDVLAFATLGASKAVTAPLRVGRTALRISPRIARIAPRIATAAPHIAQRLARVAPVVVPAGAAAKALTNRARKKTKNRNKKE